MKQNYSIAKSLLQFHGFIKGGQMKDEAGTNTKKGADVSKSEGFK
jgi:hypothetical protein